jgi:hypothetical protein
MVMTAAAARYAWPAALTINLDESGDASVDFSRPTGSDMMTWWPAQLDWHEPTAGCRIDAAFQCLLALSAKLAATPRQL